MRVAFIGRTEGLYDTILYFKSMGCEVALIVTCKEAPEYKKTSEDFEKLASELEVPFLYTPKISTPENVKFIKSLNQIDIAISHNYVSIIDDEVLEIFSLGILNAHGGDLPRYRGNACQAWAIINKESSISLCIHKMEGNSLDSGDVVVKEDFALTANTKIGEIYSWIYEIMPTSFYNAAKTLKMNPRYYLYKQNDCGVKPLRCYPRLESDSEINWNSNSEDIVRLVNASGEPFKGAFTYLNGEKLYVLDAEEYIDDEAFLGVPGQVAQIKSDGSVVILAYNSKVMITSCLYKDVVCSPSSIIKSLRIRLK